MFSLVNQFWRQITPDYVATFIRSFWSMPPVKFSFQSHQHLKCMCIKNLISSEFYIQLDIILLSRKLKVKSQAKKLFAQKILRAFSQTNTTKKGITRFKLHYCIFVIYITKVSMHSQESKFIIECQWLFKIIDTKKILVTLVIFCPRLYQFF